MTMTQEAKGKRFWLAHDNVTLYIVNRLLAHY